MKKKVTLFEVAAEAGVSIATISRVVNDLPRVDKHTRAHVKEVVKKLGYQANPAARALVLRRSDIIQTVVPDVSAGFFSNVLQGMNEVCITQHFHLSITMSQGLEDAQDLLTRMARESHCDAIVVLSSAFSNAYLQQLATEHPAIVLVGRALENSKDIPAIVIDNKQGSHLMMQHLIEHHGYRDLAIMTGRTDNADSQLRLKACQQFARKSGISIPKHRIWACDFLEAGGYEQMKLHLQDEPWPDAVFCLNDTMALGALRAAHDATGNSGKPLPIVGFDDVPMARQVGLTTIAVPMKEIGKIAAKTAVAMARGKTPPGTTIPTELRIRQSCGCSENSKS